MRIEICRLFFSKLQRAACSVSYDVHWLSRVMRCVACEICMTKLQWLRCLHFLHFYTAMEPQKGKRLLFPLGKERTTREETRHSDLCQQQARRSLFRVQQEILFLLCSGMQVNVKRTKRKINKKKSPNCGSLSPLPLRETSWLWFSMNSSLSLCFVKLFAVF